MRHSSKSSLDGQIHFAPPKKPSNDDSPVNTSKRFQPWSQSGAGFCQSVWMDKLKQQLGVHSSQVVRTSTHGATVETPNLCHVHVPWMDEIHFAPPKKPWNDDFLVNTSQQWFPMVSKRCRISSTHSIKRFDDHPYQYQVL